MVGKNVRGECRLLEFFREVPLRENNGTRIKQKIIQKLARNAEVGPESFTGLFRNFTRN